MQTFLPVADFAGSARLLDSPRLGKQRVETLQVLRALELPDYGWSNHPAVQMWRGYTPALVRYGLEMVAEWRARGFADSTETLIGEFAPGVGSQVELTAARAVPSWLGDEALHRSHRSKLLAKEPETYRPLFGDDPPDLDYLWPGPDDVPPAARPEGVGVWVVRPRAHPELGAALASGIVGLGTQSGVDVDATGLSPEELRALARELSGKRPAKDLRQLSALVDEVRPGDLVGLPVEHGAGLLLGEVVGDYAFAGRELLPHRRPARFTHVVGRSAALPPATLQDPRALFRVVLDPGAVHLQPPPAAAHPTLPVVAPG